MPHKKIGPDSPTYRDAEWPGAWMHFAPEDCAKIARSSSSMPAHLRPG